MPGDPYSALARTANSLLENDLMLISADQDQASSRSSLVLCAAHVHRKSLVLRETLDEDGGLCWEAMALDDIAARGTTTRVSPPRGVGNSRSTSLAEMQSRLLEGGR